MAYAWFFLIYLGALYRLLRLAVAQRGFLASLTLIGGALGLVLHAVTDIGLVGLYGSKLSGASVLHQNQGTLYAIYVQGYALASVADVMLSVFALSAGLLVIWSGLLPRWLGWIAVAAGFLFLLQGFTLGGLIALAGVVIDGIGLMLMLVFVLGSSTVMLLRPDPVAVT